MTAVFLGALDQTVVAAALPTIVGEFHHPDLYSWVIIAYLLTETASTPLYGKAGDLYGRRRVLMVAIVLFLIGSVLCGISGNMWQLIAFRGLQGLGAGGILSSALAIVADIVSARGRGRYQGFFVSTFALASLAGPLVGGFFVDGPGWRWVFYINLPLGLLSLIVINRLLRRFPVVTGKPIIDWWGAGLVFGGVSALVLAISTGGHQYAWTSPEIVTMLVCAVGLIGGFVLRERVAAEPILPLRLFGNAIFRVTMSLSFLIGAVTFGALVFLPQFLQLVQGYTATQAGLMIMPMLGSMVITSTITGRLVSRYGRYKVFPIVGMAILTTALLLLSRVHAHIPYAQLVGPIILLGVAMGLSLPVMTVATQNAVEPRDLGIASSSLLFLRSLGVSIGVAAAGAVLTTRLDTLLPRHVPDFHGGSNDIIDTPQQVAAMATTVREGVRVSYATSLHEIFLLGVPFALAAFVLAWFLREVELRTGSGMR
jgi:EmrB/QacA subfamily drug resistance transporter